MTFNNNFDNITSVPKYSLPPIQEEAPVVNAEDRRRLTEIANELRLATREIIEVGFLLAQTDAGVQLARAATKLKAQIDVLEEIAK